MNLKIIHSDFEIDLVDNSFTMVEENNWFNDQNITKYTYPISIVLTDQQLAQMKYVTDNDATEVDTLYDVFFYVLDREHVAVLEIEKHVGKKIEGLVRYGLEEFPNYDKLLSQLPLHKFDMVGETMIQHAEDRVDLAYPATNYNFVQVYTDQLDLDTAQWQGFEGIVNNRKNGAFLVNEYDSQNDIQINRNVIQPLPYLLYVLKEGFLDAGYVLEGDILQDPEYKDAVLYSLSEFYKTVTAGGKQEMVLLTDEFYDTGFNGFPEMGYYELEITISEAGRYKIAGNLYLRSFATFGFSFAEFWLGDEKIYDTGQSWGRFVFMDHNFDVLPGDEPMVLRFYSVNQIYAEFGGVNVYDSSLLDVTVTQITKYDVNGDLIPTLVAPDEIDLAKCVPKKTFGELMDAIRKWKNYDLSFSEGVVTMNIVETQIGSGVVVDLEKYEIKNPERIFNQAKTFEIKFQIEDTDLYKYPSIYIGVDGYVQSPYVKKAGTQEILIDAVALPLKSSQSVVTAHGYLDDDAKIQLVLYAGLSGGLNVSMDPQALSLVAVYPLYYKVWIEFLLRSIDYKWTFQATDEEIKDLTVRSTPFSYGRYHVVKSVIKRNINPDDMLVELEIASIE